MLASDVGTFMDLKPEFVLQQFKFGRYRKPQRFIILPMIVMILRRIKTTKFAKKFPQAMPGLIPDTAFGNCHLTLFNQDH